MKPLCRICPQLAVCMIKRGSDAVDPRSFYPRRIWLLDTKYVNFECFAPHRTGQQRPSNGGGPIDVFKVKKSAITKSLL